jgi:hypothetical protein
MSEQRDFVLEDDGSFVGFQIEVHVGSYKLLDADARQAVYDTVMAAMRDIEAKMFFLKPAVPSARISTSYAFVSASSGSHDLELEEADG